MAMLLVQLLLFVVIVQVIVGPLMSAYLFTRPPRLRATFRTPRDWGAPYRDVTFPGGDGVTLAGWYCPSTNGAAVILLHGHGGNRLAVAFHAEALARAGYGVLMYDLRGHGDSGGRTFSRGKESIDDALGALAFVSRQPDVDGRVGMLGVSAGGMLAIQAAARTQAIRAVAADGPILGTIHDLPPPAGLLDRLWRYPQERYYQSAIDLFSRSPRPPANVAVLPRLNGRPLLLITAGRGLEQRIGRHFQSAAPAVSTRLWELPQATHANGWHAAPEAYAQEIVGFFDRALSVEGRVTEETQSEATVIEPLTTAGHDREEEAHAAVEERQPIAEHTIAPPTAMIIAMATIPAAMLLVFIPYQLRWGFLAPQLPAGLELWALFGLLAVLAAGLFVHEAVHLLGYRLFGGVPLRALSLHFGGVPLAPQVRCPVTIPAGAYRRMLLLPALVLGILPAVVAIAGGWWFLLIWSMWLLVAAGGDVACLWAMRGAPAGAPVRAHPTRLGCLQFAQEKI
jgi:pimeloyl-ACP methyl ester carboxylesterase